MKHLKRIAATFSVNGCLDRVEFFLIALAVLFIRLGRCSLRHLSKANSSFASSAQLKMSRQLQSETFQHGLAFVLSMAFVFFTGNAQAQNVDDRIPQARLGFVLGGRINQGVLGEDYKWGTLLGIEAGYLFYLGESQLAVGPVWTTIAKGWYWRTDESSVDDLLEISELSLGLRIRHPVRQSILSFVTLGPTLLRTELPVSSGSSIELEEGRDQRLNWGMYAGLGAEMFVFERMFVALEGRFDMLIGQPQSLSMYLTFALAR